MLTGYFKGIVTQVDSTNKKVSVKILESVTNAGVSTQVSYQPNGVYKFGNTAVAIHTTGQSSSYTTGTPNANVDWFDSQTITLPTQQLIGIILQTDLVHHLMQNAQVLDLMKFMLL